MTNEAIVLQEEDLQALAVWLVNAYLDSGPFLVICTPMAAATLTGLMHEQRVTLERLPGPYPIPYKRVYRVCEWSQKGKGGK